MKTFPFRPRAAVAALLAASLAALPLAYAQAPATTSAPKAPAAPAQQPAAGGKTYSQQDLDELLAPIALYPDALLAQVLMASTYPLDVVAADRWVKANTKLKGKELEDAVQKEDWDPAVKALATLPQVLTMMSEKIDWTQKLGNAFLAQQADVMKTAQNLRKKAQEAGNLKSTPEQTVKSEQQSGQTVVVIESAKPETVYVPTYNPATVYGSWWYSYPPPYYYYPPGYAYGTGLAFATGVVVGAAIWGGCGWGNNEININTNRYNNFNKTNISNGKFEHNAANRKGVSYGDNATASKFNRGGDAKAAQSREQFRGRAEQGRSELQGMDRSQLQSQVSAADRQSRGSGDRAGGGGDRGGGGASSRGSSGGFSGAGSGASTRAASSRGSASRSSMGGGSRGGGGGGRRR